jgi:hypothetical protein
MEPEKKTHSRGGAERKDPKWHNQNIYNLFIKKEIQQQKPTINAAQSTNFLAAMEAL